MVFFALFRKCKASKIKCIHFNVLFILGSTYSGSIYSYSGSFKYSSIQAYQVFVRAQKQLTDLGFLYIYIMLFLPKRNIFFSLLSVVHPEDHLKTSLIYCRCAPLHTCPLLLL